MATHEYERPWQVMPAKIIKLALEHAERDNDFDHQVAYLLLDIGVEAALKVYLINKNQDVEEYIKFPDLLKRVKRELAKSGSDLVQQTGDILSFHDIRNTLYHKGAGMMPTGDYLSRYSAIAKRVVEEIIEVNLETEEKKYAVTVEGKRHEIEELIDHIETSFEYFQESCAIVAEKAHPVYGTREFAMKLKFILENWPDREENDPEKRIEDRKRRLEKYNELTGKSLESHGFVDYVLDDINHLFVGVALKLISENVKDDWNEYVDFDERRSRLLSSWKHGIQSERLTTEQVREEFEKTISWIETQQKKVDAWIDSHMENVYRSGPPLSPFDLSHMFDL